MGTQAADIQREESADERVRPLRPNGLSWQFDAARKAQQRWSQTTVKDRLRVVRNMRHQIVERADELVASIRYPHRNAPAETLVSELIPLADACKYLQAESAAVLAPRRLSRRGRPRWLRGVSVELRRDPVGIVLVVGASNYPLFLPGVQAVQALVAGNAVFLKPGVGSTDAARALVDVFIASGLDAALVHVLPEQPQAVEAAITAGANKVFLTGSADTGRKVQSLLARSLTPATMELSGCDAVFVLESANLDRVAHCLAFGLRFNNSATCIAPRRVFVPHAMKVELEQRLRDAVPSTEESPTSSFSDDTTELIADAIRSGAQVIIGGIAVKNGVATIAKPTILSEARPEMNLLRSDLLAPVMSLVPVTSTDEALRFDRICPYALGATVFGDDREALRFAKQIDSGCVVINDMIAPTADPRVPFGGRRHSGFGVTRGLAGLEEMTQIKAIIHQRSNWLPHLDDATPFDAKLLSGYLGMTHGRDWRRRLRSAWCAVQAAMEQRRWKNSQHERRPDDVQ